METARCLALAGAAVVLAVRSREAGEQAAQFIRETTGNQQVTVEALDLADLRSVRSFVAAWRGPLNILVNNAGVMAVPELQLTPQGHEVQFGTNFLGHYALAVGLHPRLAEAGGSRIVSLSSAAHRASGVDFADVHFDRRPYDRFVAYGQSKTATALFAVHAGTLWADDGIAVNAVHPGAIWTSLQRHTGTMRTPVELRKTVAAGAATSVLLAASPDVLGVTGKYYEDCRESPVLETLPDYYAPGVMEWAVDPEQAHRLWVLAASEISAR